MRALKTILIILAVVLGIVVILGMIGADTYRYERSVTIAAPAGTVYEHVSSLGAMDKWSPWNAYDPAMKKSIEGTDGTVGAVAKWEGNDDVGKGEQRIDSLVPDKLVRLHVSFIEPFASESDAMVELTPAGDSTKVTWAMVGENNFMSKVMGKFMDMDEMIGKDFEKGLAMLKEQAEAAAKAAPAPAFAIATVDRPDLVYVGKRKDGLKWSEMKDFFGAAFGEAGAAIGKAKLEMAGAPSGIYFKWDMENQTTDMMAAMPVKAASDVKVPGLEVYPVPAGKALHIAYYGAYEGSGAAHEAMDAHVKANGLTLNDVVIEEYVTDPMMEKDTTKWLTNIYYMLK